MIIVRTSSIEKVNESACCLLDKYLIGHQRFRTGSQLGLVLPNSGESVVAVLATVELGLAKAVIYSCWRCRRWQSRVRGPGQRMPSCGVLMIREVEIRRSCEGRQGQVKE